MSDLDDIRYESSVPEEWSEEALRDLFKNLVETELTEYHFKRVVPLQKQLAKLGHKPEVANDYAFYPKLDGRFKYNTEKRISKYHTFFTTLGMLLYQEGFIEKGKHGIFINSFDGEGNPEPLNRVEWKGAKNHCTYLIDCLIEQKIILDVKRNKNVEYIFGIENPAQIRQAYWNNKNRKPKGHEKIDDIVSAAISADEFMFDALNKPIPNKKK